MLAIPPGRTLPETLACTAERCAATSCRRACQERPQPGGNGRPDLAVPEVGPPPEMLPTRMEGPPDPDALTAAVLHRLTQAGLIRPADSEGGAPGDRGTVPEPGS